MCAMGPFVTSGPLAQDHRACRSSRQERHTGSHAVRTVASPYVARMLRPATTTVSARTRTPPESTPSATAPPATSICPHVARYLNGDHVCRRPSWRCRRARRSARWPHRPRCPPAPSVPGRLSAAEAASAVDDDALAGDEAGAFGGEEAHGVGDVARSSHPPGGHRGEIGIPDVVGDVRVAFNGDEAGCDRVHGDTGRGELAGPAAGQ